MLIVILLTVSGGMFVVASYMVLQKSRFMDGFGITLLWFGLIVGVLGFIMNDSDPSEKSSV